MTTGAAPSEKLPRSVERKLVLCSRALAWLTLAYIAVVTVGPISWRPDFGHMNIERFIGFAVLSFFFVAGYPAHRYLVAIILCSGAVGLELLQLIAPGRDASLVNLLVKLGGCAAGASAGTALTWLVARGRRTPQVR